MYEALSERGREDVRLATDLGEDPEVCLLRVSRKEHEREDFKTNPVGARLKDGTTVFVSNNPTLYPPYEPCDVGMYSEVLPLFTQSEVKAICSGLLKERASDTAP